MASSSIPINVPIGTEGRPIRIISGDDIPSFDLGVIPVINKPDALDIAEMKREDNAEDDRQYIVEQMEQLNKEVNEKLHDIPTSTLQAYIQSDILSANQTEEQLRERGFAALDEKLLQIIKEGGVSKSKHTNMWAIRRFDAWRSATQRPLTPHVLQIDYPTLGGSLLPYFFIQVCKKKQKDEKIQFYPPATLVALYKALQRAIQDEKHARERLKGELEPILDFETNPFFSPTRIALLEAMKRSTAKGLIVKPKQPKVLNPAEEVRILEANDINTPVGLIRRVVFYCCIRFFIRGSSECYERKDADFTFGTDEKGPYVQFLGRYDKNHRADLSHYQDHHFRKALKEHDKDVVRTFQEYTSKLPAKNDLSEIRHFFLTPKKQIPKEGGSWYTKTNWEFHFVSSAYQELYAAAGLSIEGVTNKVGRVTGVTQMLENGVEHSVAADLTGHRSIDALRRYDQSRTVRMEAVGRFIRPEYTLHANQPPGEPVTPSASTVSVNKDIAAGSTDTLIPIIATESLTIPKECTGAGAENSPLEITTLVKKIFAPGEGSDAVSIKEAGDWIDKHVLTEHLFKKWPSVITKAMSPSVSICTGNTVTVKTQALTNCRFTNSGTLHIHIQAADPEVAKTMLTSSLGEVANPKSEMADDPEAIERGLKRKMEDIYILCSNNHIVCNGSKLLVFE